MFLSRAASHVHVLVRNAGLGETTSAYLSSRLEADRSISIHPFTEVAELHGDGTLDGVAARDNGSGEMFVNGTGRRGQVDVGVGRYAYMATPGTSCIAPAFVDCDYTGDDPFEMLICFARAWGRARTDGRRGCGWSGGRCRCRRRSWG